MRFDGAAQREVEESQPRDRTGVSASRCNDELAMHDLRPAGARLDRKTDMVASEEMHKLIDVRNISTSEISNHQTYSRTSHDQAALWSA